MHLMVIHVFLLSVHLQYGQKLRDVLGIADMGRHTGRIEGQGPWFCGSFFGLPPSVEDPDEGGPLRSSFRENTDSFTSMTISMVMRLRNSTNVLTSKGPAPGSLAVL